MRGNCKKIVRGAKYMAKALGVTRILIAVEKNKPQAIAQFSEIGRASCRERV